MRVLTCVQEGVVKVGALGAELRRAVARPGRHGASHRPDAAPEQARLHHLPLAGALAVVERAQHGGQQAERGRVISVAARVVAKLIPLRAAQLLQPRPRPECADVICHVDFAG